jgi:hypothetical protein
MSRPTGRTGNTRREEVWNIAVPLWARRAGYLRNHRFPHLIPCAKVSVSHREDGTIIRNNTAPREAGRAPALTPLLVIICNTQTPLCNNFFVAFLVNCLLNC